MKDTVKVLDGLIIYLKLLEKEMREMNELLESNLDEIDNTILTNKAELIANGRG